MVLLTRSQRRLYVLGASPSHVTAPVLRAHTHNLAEVMSSSRHVESAHEVLDELAEVERQLQLWNTEALRLGDSVEAFAIALRDDASHISFRGDLIVLDGHPRSSDLASVIVNLARVRDVVCNLKVLHAQREKFKRNRRRAR